MRLLLAEDDPILGDGVAAGLRQAGYNVDWLQDGREVATTLAAEEYDLLILDLNLPGVPGLRILEALRARGDRLPVIIMTARDAVSDRITGLDTGADDYLVKPFDLDELLARIRALLRRHHGRVRPELVNGKLRVDPAARTVILNDEGIPLARREFALLLILLENVGKVVPRSRIESSLYAWDEPVESNSLDVHIHNLRRKLGADCIRTVRGVGYTIDSAP